MAVGLFGHHRVVRMGSELRSSWVGCCDAVHLEWMRDRLGERFLAGVVLHTGPSGFALTDQIAALPIASLWSPGGAT